MMNMNKKISVIFLIILAILSTAFAYSVNAEEAIGAFGNEDSGFIYYDNVSGEYKNEYEEFDLTLLRFDIRGRLIIESLRQHSYDNGAYIPLADLYAFYDVLCCQKGTKLPSMNETYLKGSGGDRLDVSFPYLTMNDIGMEIFKDEVRKTAFPSDIYTNLTLGFYVGGDINVCTPKEAYILSEMVRELEGSTFYYDIQTDNNGNEIVYEGDVNGEDCFLIGDEEIYFVEKEYVAVLPDGTNVRVEEVVDENGNTYYEYVDGSYQDQYQIYEGTLEWSDNNYGIGGEYPSFEYESNDAVSSDKQVPNGTKIYVTGSNIVVKKDDEYYRAEVEGNNSYIQLAWWTTIAGGVGNTVSDTPFSLEADAFEAYILQAAGVTSVNQLEYTTKTIEDADGNEKTYENAFKFEYSPAWGEHEEEFAVVFEDKTQSFLVGPYSIDYVEARAQFGGRPEVEFAGITNIEVYTDAQKEPLTYGEQWEIVYLDGERTEDEGVSEDGKIDFPKSNEKFKIRLFDAENATKITNIKVYFQYMNASGSWQELHGKYFKATWEQQQQIVNKWVPVYEDEEDLEEGEEPEIIDWAPQYDYTQYWLELTSMEEFDSQFLGLGIKAAKWYEYCTLETDPTDFPKEGKLLIEKIIVDDEGNEIEPDPNDFFTFEVLVNGAINGGNSKLKVRGGSAVESKVYYWTGDEAPTYEVSEIELPKGYEFVSIETTNGSVNSDNKQKVSGELIDGETIKIVAKNKLREDGPDSVKGSLDIVKIIEDINLPTNNYSLIGKLFNFDVTISGTFKYNGEKYEDSSVTIPVQVTATSKGVEVAPVSVGTFEWYEKDGAPTFYVKETNVVDGSQLVSINPQSGTLVANQPITVTAKNRYLTESNYIHLIKVYKGSSDLNEEDIKDLAFTFNVEVTYVDGKVDNSQIKLTEPSGRNEDGDWYWEGNTDKYVWAHGNNPTYELYEVDVPKGTKFVQEESELTGTLRNDSNPEEFEVVNTIINKPDTDNNPNKKKLELEKVITDSKFWESEFEFPVIITGTGYKYTSPDGSTTIKATKDENGNTCFIFNGDEANKQYGNALQLVNNDDTTAAIVLEAAENYNREKVIKIKVDQLESTEPYKAKGTWLSGEFEWLGDNAPDYYVSEDLLGEDIDVSIEPSKGNLGETNTEKCKVIIKNEDDTIEEDEAGYLRVIKVLENSDKYSEEELDKIEFGFSIVVENYHTEDEPLEIILDKDDRHVENNTVIWKYESNSPYMWKKGEEPLDFTVTENIDIMPEGIQFKSASFDGTEVSDVASISGKLKPAKSADDAEEVEITDVNFINEAGPIPNEGYLIIEKEVTHDSLLGEEFEFTVSLEGSFEYNGEWIDNTNEFIFTEENPLTLRGGEKATIGPIKFYGEEGPRYVVTEKENENSTLATVINSSGKIKIGTAADAVVAKFVNEPILLGGYLSITKILTNNEGPQNEPFTFWVKVGGNEAFPITLNANETYKSELYTWYKTENAPTYKVWEDLEKLPEGFRFVEITTSSGNIVDGRNAVEGTLSHNQTINVVAENQYDKKDPEPATFKVEKIVLAEKELDTAAEYKFEMIANVKVLKEGDYFKIAGQDGIYTNVDFKFHLKGGQVWESPEITWYGDAPIVTVSENLDESELGDLPGAWECLGISPNGVPIETDSSLKVTVTNKYVPPTSIVKLTTKLGGRVWEDEAQDKEGKNTPESVPNGFIDASEKAVEGVEVFVYKVVRDANGNEVERTLANVYTDMMKTEVSLPIITKNDGTWKAPMVKVPMVTDEQKEAGYTAGYDVEFVYDGQVYEPTKFLATSNGDAASFVNATTNEKMEYLNNSMALDYDREVVNNRIQTVEGLSPIDGYGNTVGTAIGNGETNSLFYESNAVSNEGNDNKKVVSKLITENEDGTVKELFKAKARTSVGGLLFPFSRVTGNEKGTIEDLLGNTQWNGWRLDLLSVDLVESELGMAWRYWYEATQPYCENINLGLVRRPDADLGLDKGLQTAKIFVKGQEDFEEFQMINFNTLTDFNTDCYTRQVESKTTVPYTLGLYSTDYYYRAEMYKENAQVYDRIVDLAKDIYSDFAEMEVELKYKITVYNESGSYLQVIKGVNDYFDSSFGAPIKVELNGSEISGYSVTETGILGSDGITYNKLELRDLNLQLASGEFAEFYVTFRVKKDTINGVHDSILLGLKSNVAEISSYSTLNLDGSNAGKVDKDSAPDNVNIRNHNEVPWYEDDTHSALVELKLKEENRTIDGQVWEDKAEGDTAFGNGKKDDDEALIGGLTTQLVEKVVVDNIEYDFVWPTNEPLNCFGGKSLKDLTGFDSTIETAREVTVMDEGTDSQREIPVGGYEFIRIPTGKYVVRFLYGNDKHELEDALEITGDPTALKTDGTSFSGKENILTANYDDDKEGMTSAVYNGQDYKATIYQAGFTSTDANGYVNNREHDLTNADLNSARVSDARDSEARRLEVMSKSETIINENANIMMTANDKNVSHKDLYEQYYMFADTAIISLDLESQNGENTTVSKIDCGLVERPETAIILDKEISSIKMTTNDNNVIFNAIYDIDYVLTNNPTDKVVIANIDGQYLVAEVKLSDSSIGLDKLQAIDKNENKLAAAREANEGTQNFRFINIDSEMFHGTTIEINYLLTALNVSETDYTSTTVENIIEVATANQTTERIELLRLAREVNENNARPDSALEIGKYLGTNYYTGNIGNDVVVTTRVRQVVDYVDNDLIFSPSMNNTKDHMWKNTSITELAGNGDRSNRLLDQNVLPGYEIVDKHGVAYITENKNNIILSVDTARDVSDRGNIGFVAKLLPYEQSTENYKSQIQLTATRTVSAQDTDLSFDNIAEIVKFQNTVGRRDALAVTGNANPAHGEFPEALKERDSSATELVTFTPPTGIETEVTMITQILIVVAIAAVIVIGGILIIKKKVL